MKIDRKKLASLSNDEKILLLEALKEKKRRRANARTSFVPHAGQLEIIKDEHSKRLLICGNGFGKTALGANEALWAVRGHNPITGVTTPVPARVIVVLDAPEKVTDTWIPELRKWATITDEQLHKRGKPYYTEITFDNGSVIRFMFHLQEPLAFESLESDLVILDEPPPRAVWIALLRSGRKKHRKGRFLMLGTPITQPWLREYYFEWQKGKYPDSQFFKLSSRLNEANLAEGYIEEFSAHLTERERATRIDGDFFNTEGMALAGLWKRERHVVPSSQLPADYKQAWPHVLALDPHPNKPTYGCLLAVAPDGKRYYVAELSKKLVARELAAWLKANWLLEHRVVDIVSDSSGTADFTGGEGFKSFVEVLNACGIRCRATSYDEKKDDEFLTRIQEALYIPEGGEPSVQFLLNCTGIARDIENVQWKAQKGTEEYQPKLEIGNKDYLACFKYALASNLTYDNSKRKVIRPPKPSPWAGNANRDARTADKPTGYMERSWARARRSKAEADDDW